jgi:hypothetical protein
MNESSTTGLGQIPISTVLGDSPNLYTAKNGSPNLNRDGPYYILCENRASYTFCFLKAYKIYKTSAGYGDVCL